MCVISVPLLNKTGNAPKSFSQKKKNVQATVVYKGSCTHTYPTGIKQAYGTTYVSSV